MSGERPELASQAPTIALALSEARSDAQQTVRELARRSGLAASQISRIEAGDIRRPSPEALRSLAAALGRPAEPLLFLAGHAAETQFKAWARKYVAAVEAIGTAFEIVEHSVRSGDSPLAALAAWRISDVRVLAEPLELTLGPGTASVVRRFADVWRGLTPDRQRLVMAILNDQERLATADRLQHDGRHPALDAP